MPRRSGEHDRRRSRPRSRTSCSSTLGDLGRPGRRRSSSAPAAAASGETFAPQGDRTTIGRSPECGIFLDDVTVSRKHAVLIKRDGRWRIEDQGSLNGTFVNRKRVDVGRAQRRRRDPDRQVPAHLPPAADVGDQPPHAERLLTIGTVCRRLQAEFPDISISKIRYLEDQGLLNPKRTQGGYRLFSRGRRRAARDDPAPAARRVPAAARDPRGARRGRRASSAAAADALGEAEEALDLDELCERAGIDARARARARGVRAARAARRAAGSASTPRAMSTSPPPARRSRASGSRRAICARSARPPTASRRCSRRSIAPALRSRNPERRRAGARGPPGAGARPRRSCPSSSSRATSVDSPASERRSTSSRTSARSRTSPSRASASRTSRRSCSTRRRSRRRSASSRRGRRSASPTSSSAPRRAASGSAPRSRSRPAAASCRRAGPGKLPPETVSATLRARVRRERARGRAPTRSRTARAS